MAVTDAVGKLCQAVVDGDEQEAASLARSAVEAGMSPTTLLQEGVQAGLDKVGNQFETGECFLPELILAGDAAKAVVDVLIPHMTADEQESAIKGTVVIGSIEGDLHDIGKNIVGALLAAHGFTVADLGTDVPPRDFVDGAEKAEASIIAVSTLLTTSRPLTRDLVRLLNDRDRRADYYVILGGGPVTPAWVADIGADGYGRDAHDAVTLCRELLTRAGRPPLTEPLCIGALQ